MIQLRNIHTGDTVSGEVVLSLVSQVFSIATFTWHVKVAGITLVISSNQGWMAV